MTIGLEVVVVTCVLANVAGLIAAAMTVYWRRTTPVGPRLLSFVVGVLLGAVLLDLLPHLWEATGNLLALAALLAVALMVSRLFDSICVCRQPPISPCASQTDHHHRGQVASPTRGAELLLAGDFIHSLVDGALIVAALAIGVVPGAVATLAVALHEVPRRIATVTLLMRAGCRPAVALVLAVCAGLGTVLGGTLAWWSAEAIRPALPIALALSAAAMLYVALAQSVSLFGVWRAHVLTLECGLPLLAGVLIIDGSHHVLELFG